MPRTLAALGSILGLLSWAAAQDSATAPDLRVQVALKNGSSIVGIAPGGCLSERPSRAGYESCPDREERKSGIRIWYYRNLDGFIFLPHKTVGDVKVLNALDPAESKILRDAAARARKEPKAAGRSEEPREAAAPGDLSAEEAGLLKLFPPDRGWSPDRYGEIQRRRIVNDVQPTGEEARFVESYAAWEKALKRSLAAKQEKPAEPAPADAAAPRPKDKPRAEIPPGG